MIYGYRAGRRTFANRGLAAKAAAPLITGDSKGTLDGVSCVRFWPDADGAIAMSNALLPRYAAMACRSRIEWISVVEDTELLSKVNGYRCTKDTTKQRRAEVGANDLS